MGVSGIPVAAASSRIGRGRNEWAIYYRDDGCDYEPSCLNCKRAVCVEDTGLFSAYVSKVAERDREIIRLHEAGESNAVIAHRLNISTRTVYRTIQRGGPSERNAQLELDDIQGKPTSQIGSPIHAPRALPVMRENARGRAI